MSEDYVTRRDPLAAALEARLRDGTFLSELVTRLAGELRDELLDRERAAVTASTACRRRVPPEAATGGFCLGCRHTNLLHPGAGNPALETCLVCEVDGLRATLAAVVTEHGEACDR